MFREIIRACALCNCVERSLHGQRELRCFGPSSLWPRPEASTSSLPLPGNDDLSSIGFSESHSLVFLVDDTGIFNAVIFWNPFKGNVRCAFKTIHCKYRVLLGTSLVCSVVRGRATG